MPRDRKLGACVHGKIGAFYFYLDGSADDAAFGFCDIEVSVQHVAQNKVRFELYCIADGYQSARGVGSTHPVTIAIMAKGRTLAFANWHFADVICGHADPMSFGTELDIADEFFTQIDGIQLQNTKGESRPCESKAQEAKARREG